MRRYIGIEVVGLCLSLATCTGCGPGASSKSEPPTLSEAVGAPQPEAAGSVPVAAAPARPGAGKPKLMAGDEPRAKGPGAR